MSKLPVAFVSSEVAPWSQTGGLGDVGGALPQALNAQPDLDVIVFTPLYRSARAVVALRGLTLEALGDDFVLGEGTARLLRLVGGPTPTVFVDAPHLFDRAGLYGPGSGSAYTDTGKGAFDDNLERFSRFCEAVVSHGHRAFGAPIALYHCHDWQAALVPGLLPDGPERPGCVLTIHNLAYQGVFAGDQVLGRAAPPAYQRQGHLNLLAGAIAMADQVTTVSPHYAEEITTVAYGCGLEANLRWRGVTGIVNGIDTRDWNPRQDSALPAPFDAADLRGRAEARRGLLAEFGLPDEPGTLLLGVVSRLAGQKGPDLVAELVPRLGSLRARLIVLGSGEPAHEAHLQALSVRHRHRFGLRLDFDRELARRIYGGVDAILVPSRFEPCGLVQMYAMAYGALPIVSPVGGLVDTVTDASVPGAGTGFVMEAVHAAALARAVQRAADLLREEPEAWGALQQRAMATDWSWQASASAWARLFRAVMAPLARAQPAA
jgi:starch synthase